jgi:aspartate/methionine/tyrosine aminotransferase
MAFLAVVKALCPPNTSSALLPLPAYFNLGMSLSLQSVKPVYIPCDPENRFIPSLSGARTCLETVKGDIKPKMIVLVSPSNPTGTIFTHEELKGWYDLAREFEVALVLDETYKEFVEAEQGEEGMGVPHELFKDPEWRSTLISLGSFSSECHSRIGGIILIDRGVSDTRSSSWEYSCCAGAS